jgi:hypothetical protein
MSDVVVTVVESNTNVTVTEQDVAVAVTETSVDVSTSTAGIQGATGATGAGYSGVTSVSTITIGSGLKTFTLVSGNQGAFLTGMRVRAIHSDTPTYYMEGTANYIGAGTLIITVDKFNGSGSHNSWAFASAGEVGQTGATGASGVVSVTSPITNTGTSGSAIVGIDQTLLSITQSQVTSLVTDLAGKASLGAANAFTVGGHVITNAATAVVPLALKAVASQSANTLELQNSSGSPITYFTASGRAVIGSDSSAMLNVVANGSATVGAVIKGASGQSTDIFRVQNSGATNLFRVDQFGGIYSTFASITSDAAATRPLLVKGAASQSANLFEAQTSAGGTAAFIAVAGNASFASGNFAISSIGSVSTSGSLNSSSKVRAGSTGSAYNGVLEVTATGATLVGAVIQGAASQSANLQEWQNSGGTVLSRVNANGILLASQVRTLNSQFQATEENGGGATLMVRQTAVAANPGANYGKLYFRDGTTAGTLKLVVRAGAAGAETTILDNIPQ